MQEGATGWLLMSSHPVPRSAWSAVPAIASPWSAARFGPVQSHRGVRTSILDTELCLRRPMTPGC